MAKNYVVPKRSIKAYQKKIRRANARLKRNIDYIIDNRITNANARRTMVQGYGDPDKWASKTQPFSMSTRGRYIWNADTNEMEFKAFKNKGEFDAYIRHIEKWSGKTAKSSFASSPDRIKKAYKKAIIKALNEVKDHYSITLPNGKIPRKVIKMLDEMSLEQITNFFSAGDPTEDVEVSQFDSDDFLDVADAEGFTSVIEGRINAIKKLY